MKDYAKRFYKSVAWRRCRDAYFAYQHGLCERCDKPGKIVHHKNYITPENINDPDVTLNHSNLELLCQDCHNREHHERTGVTRYELKFDAMGNLIERRSPPFIIENGRCWGPVWGASYNTQVILYDPPSLKGGEKPVE